MNKEETNPQTPPSSSVRCPPEVPQVYPFNLQTWAPFPSLPFPSLTFVGNWGPGVSPKRFLGLSSNFRARLMSESPLFPVLFFYRSVFFLIGHLYLTHVCAVSHVRIERTNTGNQACLRGMRVVSATPHSIVTIDWGNMSWGINDKHALSITIKCHFILYSFYALDVLGHPNYHTPANFMSPLAHIVLEWCFLSIYAILCSRPDTFVVINSIFRLLITLYVAILFQRGIFGFFTSITGQCHWSLEG
jgi:hypothetical protein